MNSISRFLEKPSFVGGVAIVTIAAVLVSGLAWVVEAKVKTYNRHLLVTPANDEHPLSQDDVEKIVEREIVEHERVIAECRTTWKAATPAVAAACGETWQLCLKCQTDIDTMLREAGASVDAVAFAESVCSMESAWSHMVNGSWAHEDWLWERFRDQVIRVSDLSHAIEQRLQLLNRELTDVHARLLVELNDESVYAGASIAAPEVKLGDTWNCFHNLSNQSSGYMGRSWGEFGVAYTAGAIASSMMSSLLESNQEDAEESSMLSALGSIGTDLMVGEAVEATISTSEVDLREMIETGVRKELNSLMLGQPGSQVWAQPMADLYRQHQMAVLLQLIEKFHVEEDWAFEVLNNHIDELNRVARESASQNQSGGAL